MGLFFKNRRKVKKKTSKKVTKEVANKGHLESSQKAFANKQEIIIEDQDSPEATGTVSDSNAAPPDAKEESDTHSNTKARKKRSLFFRKKAKTDTERPKGLDHPELTEKEKDKQKKREDKQKDRDITGQKKAKKDVKDQKTGIFSRFRKGMSKTRSAITGRLDRLFLGKKEITEDLLDELEEILFTSDIGVATTQALIDSVREKVSRKELKEPEKLKSALKDHISSFLEVEPVPHQKPAPGEPRVIMVVGVNGVGKTTTIGKLAYKFKSQGQKVMLAAADTFRAAAIEQLEIWGERVGAEVISHKSGSDPSSVVFDAIASAVSKNADTLLIDTAGRLHTKKNLMDELSKIHRVAGKKLTGAPHEIWLTLDATTGQNAISQAEKFNEKLGITGIILTKLDGTAKGGIVVGISHQLGIPVKYIGVGEQIDDLKEFDAQDFITAIFD